MIQASIGHERDFDRVAEALTIHTDEFTSKRAEDTWPEAREKERAKTKTTPCAVHGFTSRRSRSKSKGKPNAYSEDPATYDDYDCDDDAVELADVFQTYTDPADPGSDDGDDVQHEHDNDDDTSGSYLAVDSVTTEAELDAIALLVDTWDVDLMSDLEVSNGKIVRSPKTTIIGRLASVRERLPPRHQGPWMTMTTFSASLRVQDQSLLVLSTKFYFLVE